LKVTLNLFPSLHERHIEELEKKDGEAGKKRNDGKSHLQQQIKSRQMRSDQPAGASSSSFFLPEERREEKKRRRGSWRQGNQDDEEGGKHKNKTKQQNFSL